MPTLADIYSAINTAKRKGADFAQNPGTSLQQMLGNANDQARGFNQLNDQALAEMQQTGRLTGPAGQQLMQTMGQAYQPVGMTVYHGSPHVFEKFDLSKIGTGEGNQSYGRGMYVAQAPDVAKSYKAVNADVSNDPIGYASQIINSYNGNSEKALSYLKAILPAQGEKTFAGGSRDLIQNTIKSIEDQSYKNKEIGNLYKVDLPDTHIRRMLDWDEPLKNQPAPIRKLAKSLGIDLNDAGADLLAQIGKGQEGKQILEKAGIRGVKYLDQESRNASGWHITPPSNTVSGKWMVKGSDYNSKGSHFETEKEAKDYMKQKIGEATRNFVVFDPNHLTILERNNRPIK